VLLVRSVGPAELQTVFDPKGPMGPFENLLLRRTAHLSFSEIDHMWPLPELLHQHTNTAAPPAGGRPAACGDFAATLLTLDAAAATCASSPRTHGT
jgi:hypothetical protein